MQISDKINLIEYPIDNIYGTYGQLENMKNNHEDAAEYFMKALKWRKTIYGDNSKEVGFIYIELAFTYISLEQYGIAEEWAQKALSIENHEVYKHIITTNAYVALGNICMEKKEFEKALINYREAEENYNSAGKPLGNGMSEMLSEMKNNARNKTYDNGS